MKVSVLGLMEMRGPGRENGSVKDPTVHVNGGEEWAWSRYGGGRFTLSVSRPPSLHHRMFGGGGRRKVGGGRMEREPGRWEEGNGCGI